MLFTTRARRRQLLIWQERAMAAWEQIGRQYVAAWGAELNGSGEPRVTLRWQILLARTRFYLQRVAAALAALKGGR